MNYYERIQKAIDFLEDNLENDIRADAAAKEAYMSVSNFYRLFFAITGFQAKEYLILRRMSLAAYDICHGMKVLDAAVKYAYTSADAFSRTFKKVTGFPPSACSRERADYKFERINVMDKYFEIPDEEMDGQYPDIKILKEMPPMRVAYFCYYGKNPEDGAFAAMSRWVLQEKLDMRSGNYRIFGYNAPDCDPSAEEYGYEVCVTIPEDMEVTDEKIKTKHLGGGLYAVITIERTKEEELGEGIMRGWKRFSNWLEGSKYVYGDAQWLEEHLGFDDAFAHTGGVELYMPVRLKKDIQAEFSHETEEFVEPFMTVSCTATGAGAEGRARKQLSAWMADRGILPGRENSRLFAFYNFEMLGSPDFFYRLYIQIPYEMEIKDGEGMIKEEFPGGLYLKRIVKYAQNGRSWFDFIKQLESSDQYGFGPQPFMEEYLVDTMEICGETEVAQYMPVVKKEGEQA